MKYEFSLISPVFSSFLEQLINRMLARYSAGAQTHREIRIHDAARALASSEIENRPH